MTQNALRSVQDCQDFIRGCTLLGTGGGGDPQKGMELFQPALAAGKEFRWVDIEDLHDDAWTASCWGMGSLAPQSPTLLQERAALGLRQEDREYNMDQAVVELGRYAGHEVEALVPDALKYWWTGTTATEDPKAKATFGIYSRPTSIIYQRESR